MQPRPSSVIAPARGRGESLEIYLTQRRHDLRFLGGLHAFFGGAVDEGDDLVPLAGPIHEGFPPHRYYGCAVREFFEEWGILVTSDGIFASGLDPKIAVLRDKLTRDEISIVDVFKVLDTTMDTDRFLPIGEWITPDFSPIRFQSEFFIVHFTDAELEQLEGHDFEENLQYEELLTGEWVRPADGLERWRRGELFITQPIRYVFQGLLCESPESLHVDESVATSLVDYAETTGGIYVIPLRSATIPPATHTNCLLVGDDVFVIVDPASDIASELALLDRAIRENIEIHKRTPIAILLTHHHPDHVDGVAHVANRWSLPVWAHRKTDDRLAGIKIDRHLEDGEVLDELGDDRLTVLHTPGHADGHLAFLHTRTSTLIAGDLVASASTILIDPRDGHIGDYLASLTRIRDEIRPRTLLPSHGWLVTAPHDKLSYYVDHRLEREEKVYEALRSFGKPATPHDLLADAYDDVPHHIWPIAARSALAHLIHLVEEGRAQTEDERFVAL